MKIAWVADFRDIDRQGGAQLTNRLLTHFAFLQKKHQVVEIGLHNLTLTDKFLTGFDLYIINNWVEIYQHEPGKNFLNYIVDNKPFVRFVHDYDEKDNIPETEPLRKKLFEKAKLVITLSPLHTATLKRIYPLPANTISIPPYIEDLFSDSGFRRLTDEVIGVGEVNERKGILNFIEYAKQNPQKRFHFFTWEKDTAKYKQPNIYFYPPVNNHYLHIYYNMFDSFIHLPKWKEPFGRAVAEAYLSNCNMIVNDNIGFFSYKWDYKDREKIREIISFAPRDFWLAVEKCI